MVHWIWNHDCLNHDNGDSYSARISVTDPFDFCVYEMVWPPLHLWQNYFKKKAIRRLWRPLCWSRILTWLSTCSSNCHCLSNIYILNSFATAFANWRYQFDNYILDGQDILVEIQQNTAKLWWKNYLSHVLVLEVDVPIPFNWRSVPSFK